MELNCLLCNAPLHTDEFPAHLKACMKIKVGLDPKPAPAVAPADPRDDRWLAYQRNMMSNPLHAYPPDVASPTPPPGGTTDKVRSWYENQYGKQQVPEGKAQCAICNGIKHMYPDCWNCGGTGFVDVG